MNDLILIHQYMPIPIGSNVYGGKHWDFCKYLVQNGKKVTVLTAASSHVYRRNIKINWLWSVVENNGINLVLIKTINLKHSRGYKRILNWILFSTVSLIYLYRTKIPKNLLISILPQTLIITYLLRYFWVKKRPKLFLEIRDIWPLSASELLGLSKNSFLYRSLQILEKIGYNQSDLILSPLNNFNKYLNENFSNFEQKFFYFPNGVSKQLYTNYVSIIKQNINNNSSFKLGYFGGLGISNDLVKIFKSFHELKLKSVELHIFGEGSEKNILINKFPNLNIHFHKPVDRVSSIAFMKSMDALCMALPVKALYKYGVASLKLVDYLIAAKPIILYASNEMDFIEKNKLGYNISIENNQINLDIIISKLISKKNIHEIAKNQQSFLRNFLVLDSYYQKLITHLI